MNEEDEKIQVWKDEIAMHGGTISDEVKVKDLKKLNEDLKEEKYNGGTAYTEFLKLFSKENRETALVFRIKCIAKKCRETGKWDLLSRLCYKYSWINLTAGEADYD